MRTTIMATHKQSKFLKIKLVEVGFRSLVEEIHVENLFS